MIARASWLLAASALLASACAHAERPSGINGEAIAPGIYSFDAQRARVSSNIRPWEPAVFYPALAPPAEAPPRTSTASGGPIRASMWLWFRGYQATLSRIDGTTCRFHPTCSAFGLDAMAKHGPYGLLMTFARLNRNHADSGNYEMSTPPFLDDPLSNYTFTFRRPQLDDFAAYHDPAHAWYQHVRATQRLAK